MSVEPEHVEHDEILGDTEDLTRLLALSDGVFAFAITLLVLDVRLPDTGSGQPGELAARLVELAPRFVSYLISFYVIGTYWYLHQRILRHVRRSNTRLTFLNLLLLLFVTLLPATTIITRTYANDPLGVAIHATNISLAGLVMWFMWRHGASGSHPLLARLPHDIVVRVGRRLLILPIGFGLSIVVALLNPGLAYLCWTVTSVIAFVSNERLSREVTRMVHQQK